MACINSCNSASFILIIQMVKTNENLRLCSVLVTWDFIIEDFFTMQCRKARSVW